MVKVIAPGSYEWGESQARLVKTARAGLRGDDLRAFVKRAGHELADALQRIDLRPGDVPVHLLAVGATEFHGPNRNGDGFEDAVCRKYHPTFVKHARWYHNHNNKDPEKSYGVIKYSYYNPSMHRIELLAALNGTKEAAARNGGLVADEELEKLAGNEDIAVSMACVTDPDTPVLTPAGYVPIADVKVGDLVYTHAGRWRPVTSLNRRRYTGGLARVRLEGLPEPLHLTADHPMYAKVLAAYPATLRSQRPVAQWAAEVEGGARPFDWVHAGHLGQDDRISCVPVTGVPGHAGVIDKDLAEFLGIYTAEGSLGYNGDNPCTVVLTVHSDDWAVRGVPPLVQSRWPGVTVGLRPKNNSKVSFSLEIFSADLGRWLAELVGTSVDNKRVPAELYNATRECKLAFLGRWLDGDGFCDKKGVHWSSKNYRLALQARDLLLSVGVPSSIYKIVHKGEGTYKRGSAEYTVNVSNFDAPALVAFSAKADASPFVRFDRRAKPASVYRVGDGYAYRVTAVDHSEAVDVQTYNLEVEEDHSYSLAGLVSHNCKVPFDICSGCNNRARNRGEYCRGVDQGGHCKMGGLHDRITLVDDDGNQLYARNTEPTFFDMSKVFRPADRIAWVTGQVKAAGDAFLSGVQLADAWQVSAPAHLSDDPRVHRWSKLAARLADVERRVEADGLGYHGLAWSPSVQPDLPWDDHGVRPAEALSALQLCRVCPPLGGYIKMAGVSDAGPVAAQARKYLPGIYGRMLDDGTLASVDLDAFYGAPGVPPPRARAWAEKRAADYGLSAEDVRRRTVLASLRGEGVPAARPVAVKTAARRSAAVKVAGAAYEVAKNYALFKLALLDRLPRDDDFPGACGTAVRQNYV